MKLFEGMGERDMTTWSGLYFDPRTIAVEDVDIADIAHALSRQCRYNGHVDGFLSVARHSIWVANAVPSHALWGLLHDAAEAYLGDLISPLKNSPFGETYHEMEDHVEAVVAEAFGLSYPPPPEVKEGDRYVVRNIEMVDYERQIGARWTWDSTPQKDEHDFMATFRCLI